MYLDFLGPYQYFSSYFDQIQSPSVNRVTFNSPKAFDWWHTAGFGVIVSESKSLFFLYLSFLHSTCSTSQRCRHTVSPRWIGRCVWSFDWCSTFKRIIIGERSWFNETLHLSLSVLLELKYVTEVDFKVDDQDERELNNYHFRLMTYNTSTVSKGGNL